MYRCSKLRSLQTSLQVPGGKLQIQSESCDNERKPLLSHSSSQGGTIKGSLKKSGTAIVRQRHVHFSETQTNTGQEMKGSQLPHKDCDVRCTASRSVHCLYRFSPAANLTIHQYFMLNISRCGGGVASGLDIIKLS